MRIRVLITGPIEKQVGIEPSVTPACTVAKTESPEQALGSAEDPAIL